MCRTLNDLYGQMHKHAYPLINEALTQYCAESDIPEANREFNYFYGKNSLKWFIATLDAAQLDDEELYEAFYLLITEGKALGVDYLTNVSIAPQTFRKYKNYLKKQKPKFNKKELLNNFKKLEFNGFKVVCNETEHNVTNLIFKELKADLILAVNPTQPQAAIIFNAAKVNTGLFEYIKTQIKLRKEDWTIKGDNLLVSHNTIIIMQEMQEYMVNYFLKNKSYE